MGVDLSVLVLPAMDDIEGLPSETTPWRQAYSFDQRVAVPGIPEPVRYTTGGIGLVPTGIGKTAAATTTTALFASDQLDLAETLVLSVGVAGGPPTLPIGSVVIADRILDWDDKCRFDPDPTAQPPITPNPYTGEQGVTEISPPLRDWAQSHATQVDLSPVDGAGSPVVRTGVNVCGEELWHGQTLAASVEWLVAERTDGSYLATEMEDSGTIQALDRFDQTDRYLSIRGIANHDRQPAGQTARESFFDPEFESGFQVGRDNAVAVARRVIAAELDRTN